MDTQTAERLVALNSDFYQNHFSSFSATRSQPWQGWKQCLDALEQEWTPLPTSCSVLDLACGNLRFEVYLHDSLPSVDFDFHAVDNCDPLAQSATRDLDVHFQCCDLLEPLLSEQSPDPLGETPRADLTVSFGFLHHIPGEQHRRKFLQSMLGHTAPGGLVMVSLWQFMNDPARTQTVEAANERALSHLGLPALDEGDFLLGWQARPNAYRYCHHFSSNEIDRLIGALSPQGELVSRFSADGKNNNMNTYLVFTRR
ncbi:MAG: class I SAM-dependent methyltransferase [Propionibacteriaceae bacterium]|jgi:SAM-dependent methyltransferase|nr:class I SAM-dependent methyltransferase [Propionibacteriaceae bacterium]